VWCPAASGGAASRRPAHFDLCVGQQTQCHRHPNLLICSALRKGVALQTNNAQRRGNYGESAMYNIYVLTYTFLDCNLELERKLCLKSFTKTFEFK
jgi:hypothetical protein